MSDSDVSISCPVCNRTFNKRVIEEHVNKCLFLKTPEQNCNKRHMEAQESSLHSFKRTKVESPVLHTKIKNRKVVKPSNNSIETSNNTMKCVPLAEKIRPALMDDIIGHNECFGPGTLIRSLIDQNNIPNMILWGPPGCGKTSLANVIGNICKKSKSLRFVKLSATMVGINSVKEIVEIAKNESQFQRRTILFMDEIHRFNKLQQDTFLPHVENGTIKLIGATTENPSFSLNNALLSRCRVITMNKLSGEAVLQILKRAVELDSELMVMESSSTVDYREMKIIPKVIIEPDSLKWLAEICDGDARIALGALELATLSKHSNEDVCVSGPAVLTLDDCKNSIKRTHMLYDKKGEEHYNTVSAIHKSIRASDENAALYWTTRALHGGEDPLFIARRFIRIAGEDIGLADPNAMAEAVACFQGCQNIGMPECDVLLVQCAVRLARAPKSREVYLAMKKCQEYLKSAKGPLPSIPLHLRNAPTRLMKDLGYGSGYNLQHKDISGITYMPDGMEDVDFFMET
ncbi:hypothetical protein ACJJTC_012068 [Scirpophaga incertulas]